VDGYSLRELLDDGALGAESIGARVAIARQVGAALQHAHAHGIIHRDVRPENIIVQPDGNVVLTNFDLAHVDGAGTLGSMVTSRYDARYTAVEMWGKGAQASPLSDQFALGMVVLELLAGRSFPEGPVPDLEQWQANPPLDREERELVLKMCGLRPDERYATLDEALESLRYVG
jgi:serine/threonine-protein kinase